MNGLQGETEEDDGKLLLPSCMALCCRWEDTKESNYLLFTEVDRQFRGA